MLLRTMLSLERKKMKFTRTQLAAEMNVNEQSIKNLECIRSGYFDKVLLDKYAAYFNLNAEELYKLAGKIFLDRTLPRKETARAKRIRLSKAHYRG